MTITSTPSEITYTGDGVSTVFTIPFVFDTSADLKVVETVAGLPTVVTTGFSIAGGAGLTGTLTRSVALPVGTNILILDNPALTQPVDYVDNDRFPAATHEGALDRVTRLVKRLNERVDRSLRVADGDLIDGDNNLLPIVSARQGKYLVFGASGAPTVASGTGNDSALRTDLATTTSGADGSRLVGYRNPGTGSVARSVFNVLSRTVFLEDFGGAPGAGDNTAAMNAAAAAINALGGGTIILGTPGEWRMNWVCLYNNIGVVYKLGFAEYDVYCIRPFSLASAPITFGDGTKDIRFCWIDAHVSGTDIPGTYVPGAGNSPTVNPAYAQSAHCAPHALLLKGGVVSFYSAPTSRFYNGIRTVSLEPSATKPVTGCRMYGAARNDTNDSVNARTLYGKRLADPGFYTDNIFDMKVNGPTLGYAMEVDGTGSAIVAEIGGYWDIKPGHGVFLKSSAAMRPRELTLDPGTTGVVVIETDQAQDAPTRWIFGSVHHGGQKIQFAGAVIVSLPNEADEYSYKALVQRPYLILPAALTYGNDPFDAGGILPTFDSDSTTGPITLNRADFSVKTLGKGLRVKEGANAKMGVATLVAGTVTVANTSVAATSRIFAFSNVDGGTPGWLRNSSRVNGTSFTITSSNAADTSTIVWIMYEPA